MPILVILRILIGLFFIVVSGDKLLQPYQNFLYIVQSYSFFPSGLAELVARVMPWVEFFLGLFLVLGLWLQWTLRIFMLMMVGFVVILAQALLRKLPLDDCGCFGNLFSVPVYVTLMMDVVIFTVLAIMNTRLGQVSQGSLDGYFSKSE